MFEVGSRVVYRSEGICIVSDIREENFGAIGGTEKYYILTPVRESHSTLYVPMNNERLCSMMRKILSAKEINELCSSLRDERMEWIEDNRARNNEFRNLLSEGDREKLIVLANTIVDRSHKMQSIGRWITGGDENFLRRAVSMLYSEFSYTTDVSSEDNVFSVLCGELELNDK